jgi:hypothetical protein
MGKRSKEKVTKLSEKEEKMENTYRSRKGRLRTVKKYKTLRNVVTLTES